MPSYRALLLGAMVLATTLPSCFGILLSLEIVRQAGPAETEAALAVVRERAMVAGFSTVGVAALIAVLAAMALYRPLARIRSGLEVMTGPNRRFRLGATGPPDLAAAAVAIDRLADRAEHSREEVEARLIAATREVASEKDTLASVLFALADGVVVCDERLRITLANAAARRMLSLSARPLRRGEEIYSYLDPSLVRPLLEALEVDEESARLEHGVLTLPSGEQVQLSATLAGSAEIGRHYVLVLRDVSEQVAVDRSRGRLIADAVQRLRSPTASILSAAEILSGYDELSPARRREFLDMLLHEAARVAAELDSMHEAASAGTSPSWSAEVAIGSLVERSVAEMSAALNARRQRVDLSGEPALVVADRLALLQLVRRLLQLASARLPDGGELRVRWRTVDAAVGQPPLVELAVLMPGVTPEAVGGESLFDVPLQDGRIDWVEMAPTVRSVASEHRGELWVRREADGAALVLVLPAARAAAESTVDLAADAVGRQVLALLGQNGFYHPGATAGRAKPAHADELLAELTFAVFDLETTGLEPGNGDGVVSIGAVRVESGQIIREDHYFTLVDPERPVPLASTRIHGITDEMVRGQPRLADVLPAFVEYVGDSVPVAHVASFDLAFLNPTLAAIGRPPLGGGTTLDTLILSYSLFPDWDGYNLEEIAGHLGVRVVGRHTSLGDALVTAEILVRLLDVLRSRGARTLGDALKLQGGDVLRKAIGAVRARLAWG